jgi:hypothetical protein
VLLDHADLDGHDQLAALMAESRYPPIGETLEFISWNSNAARWYSQGHRPAGCST